MSKSYYVYIIANNRPTLYIGVTNDLIRRAYEHKQGKIEGFTSRYKLTKLIYYEQFNDIEEALYREKQLKHWNREWKLELIRKENPTFRDIYFDLV